MEKPTLKQQWAKLNNVREWIGRQLLPNESDSRTRDALFEAQKAIGFAQLYLEEVEFRTSGAYSSTANFLEDSQEGFTDYG
jgi:hypothetical protein